MRRGWPTPYDLRSRPGLATHLHIEVVRERPPAPVVPAHRRRRLLAPPTDPSPKLLTDADLADLGARTAWIAAGDRIAELATLDPSEETLELGSRWARLRPSGAMPTADQIRAMNPMLVAHGRIIPAYDRSPTSGARLCDDDVDASATS